MHLTFVGVGVLLAGLLVLLVGRTPASLALLLACGPMGGSAAITLGALGSSIPPFHFALGLALVRIAVALRSYARDIEAALRDNAALIVFTLYGVAMAYLAPRLFLHRVSLTPLRAADMRTLYDVTPLAPSSQNLTTSVYLVGTLACALFTYIVCNRGDNWRVFVKTAVVVGWVNLILGVLSVAGKGTPIDTLLGAFRNGAYAQLTHEYRGFIRVTGIFPEASSFAAFTFAWFCFIFECWLRDVMPRRTGPLAAAMFATLLMSTSSSAYVGLGMFLLALTVRLLLSPSLAGRKLPPMLIAGIAAATLSCGALLAAPRVLAGFEEMVLHMTVEKAGSKSGLQRSFQARKSIDGFTASHGLGVGPGSFRSSGLFFAILGSSGIVGLVTFLLYLVQVMKPLYASTYRAVADPRVATGVAAGWAALIGLIPASLAASSPDVGVDFAILAGAALALRATARQPAVAAPAMEQGAIAAPSPAAGWPEPSA